MKSIIKLFFAASFLLTGIAACDKVDDLTLFTNGTTPTLSVNNTTVAPTAADSLSEVLNFSWTSALYATDTSNYKYILEIDSAGRNFSNPSRTTIIGDQLHHAFLAKDFNSILLGLGFDFNIPGTVEARVISSYANNNERLISNSVTVQATVYVTPPKVELPSTGKLFLVGSSSQGGWNNPVPVPTQEFGKIDSVTYVGVFNMNGGGNFIVLTTNGSWDFKYSIQDNSLPGVEESGDFGYGLPQDFKGPVNSGWYKITLDFQRGKYTIEPYVGAQIPNELFIVGNATPGGWNNPVPVPSQQLTRLNAVQYELEINMTANSNYLLLPINGDWSQKYSVEDNTLSGLGNGGFFGFGRPQDFPSPATDGLYKLELNFGIQDASAPANTAWFKTTAL